MDSLKKIAKTLLRYMGYGAACLALGGLLSLVPEPYRQKVLEVVQAVAVATTAVALTVMFWAYAYLFLLKRRKRSLPKPELIGELLGFLVPRGTRATCFAPFFEDLKADRLEKIARKPSRRVKRWIEFCFYFRLCVTVVQSLGCYLGDSLAKIAPFIRALFFRGGS